MQHAAAVTYHSVVSGWFGLNILKSVKLFKATLKWSAIKNSSKRPNVSANQQFHNRPGKMRQPLFTVCYWCALTAQRESPGMYIKTEERFSNHLAMRMHAAFWLISKQLYNKSYCKTCPHCRAGAGGHSWFTFSSTTLTDRQTCHCTQLLDKLFHVQRTVRRAKTYKTCPLCEQPIPLLQIKVRATNLLRLPLSFSHSLLWDWILFQSLNLSVVRSPIGDKDRKQGGLLATLLPKQDDRIAHFRTEKEKDTVTCLWFRALNL